MITVLPSELEDYLPNIVILAYQKAAMLQMNGSLLGRPVICSTAAFFCG
jgi:hypothetical protein